MRPYFMAAFHISVAQMTSLNVTFFDYFQLPTNANLTSLYIKSLASAYLSVHLTLTDIF